MYSKKKNLFIKTYDVSNTYIYICFYNYNYNNITPRLAANVVQLSNQLPSTTFTSIREQLLRYTSVCVCVGIFVFSRLARGGQDIVHDMTHARVTPSSPTQRFPFRRYRNAKILQTRLVRLDCVFLSDVLDEAP